MQSLARHAHAKSKQRADLATYSRSAPGSFELNVDTRRSFELAQAPSGAFFLGTFKPIERPFGGRKTVGIGFREFLILAFVLALYLVVALIRACLNTKAREIGQAAADFAEGCDASKPVRPA